MRPIKRNLIKGQGFRAFLWGVTILCMCATGVKVRDQHPLSSKFALHIIVKIGSLIEPGAHQFGSIVWPPPP